MSPAGTVRSLGAEPPDAQGQVFVMGRPRQPSAGKRACSPKIAVRAKVMRVWGAARRPPAHAFRANCALIKRRRFDQVLRSARLQTKSRGRRLRTRYGLLLPRPPYRKMTASRCVNKSVIPGLLRVGATDGPCVLECGFVGGLRLCEPAGGGDPPNEWVDAYSLIVLGRD